jgi:hypothetical protein
MTGAVTAEFDGTDDILTFTTGSGKDVITSGGAVATKATISTGAGNDTLTFATASKVVLDGGDGYDKVTMTGDMTALELTNIEEIATGGNITAAKTSQLSDKSYILSGANAITFGTAAANFDTSTIDLSSLQINGVTGITVNVANGLSSSLYTSTTGATITGSSTADTISGTANDDTIVAGEGADLINTTDGNDSVDVSEVTAAEDVIALTTADLVTVTGFDVGSEATADEFTLDESAIEALTSVTDLVSTDAASTDASAGTPANVTLAFETITAAATIGGGAGKNILIVDGDIADAATLETALETGGDFAITSTNAFGVKDAILVAYDNGVDTFIAAVATTAGIGAGAKAAAGDLTATNMIHIVGLADVTDLDAGNFNALIA